MSRGSLRDRQTAQAALNSLVYSCMHHTRDITGPMLCALVLYLLSGHCTTVWPVAPVRTQAGKGFAHVDTALTANIVSTWQRHDEMQARHDQLLPGGGLEEA